MSLRCFIPNWGKHCLHLALVAHLWVRSCPELAGAGVRLPGPRLLGSAPLEGRVLLQRERVSVHKDQHSDLNSFS